MKPTLFSTRIVALVLVLFATTGFAGNGKMSDTRGGGAEHKNPGIRRQRAGFLAKWGLWHPLRVLIIWVLRRGAGADGKEVLKS